MTGATSLSDPWIVRDARSALRRLFLRAVDSPNRAGSSTDLDAVERALDDLERAEPPTAPRSERTSALTVARLIGELSALPQDAVVWLECRDCCDCCCFVQARAVTVESVTEGPFKDQVSTILGGPVHVKIAGGEG